jgi:hypothetical protein
MKIGLASAGLFCSGLMLSSALAEEPAVLSAEGYSNIKIGMVPERLERALGQKFAYNPYTNHGCSLFTTPQMEQKGLSFVIDKKLLVRINVDYYSANSKPRAIKTAAGIGLGMSEEELLKAYGAAAVVKPNPGDPTWHTIFVDSADHTSGLAFETDGKTIKSMRAGNYPGLDVETACSAAEK